MGAPEADRKRGRGREGKGGTHFLPVWPSTNITAPDVGGFAADDVSMSIVGSDGSMSVWL